MQNRINLAADCYRELKSNKEFFNYWTGKPIPPNAIAAHLKPLLESFIAAFPTKPKKPIAKAGGHKWLGETRYETWLSAIHDESWDQIRLLRNRLCDWIPELKDSLLPIGESTRGNEVAALLRNLDSVIEFKKRIELNASHDVRLRISNMHWPNFKTMKLNLEEEHLGLQNLPNENSVQIGNENDYRTEELGDQRRLAVLNRLADRLQNLKNQNLAIRTALIHQLTSGDNLELPPEFNTSKGRVCFGGFHGYRADLLIPITGIGTRPDGSTVEVSAKQYADASNSFMVLDNDRGDKDRYATFEAENEFWRIATELGRVVKTQMKLLRTHGLWKKWLKIDRLGDENTWVDFVFELAWLSLPELPIVAKKAVFWERSCFEFDVLDDGFYSMVRRIAGQETELPDPVPTWFSIIDDIVSASQYAIDFLISEITNKQDAISVHKPKSTDKNSTPESPLLVTMKDLNKIFTNIKAQTLKKDAKVSWPKAVLEERGKASCYNYCDVRTAIANSSRKDKAYLVSTMPIDENKARELIQR